MEPSRETRTPVLIVNNDPAVRDMLANLLSEEGFHIALAGSGAEALKIAANAPFETAIVELFLPDCSGVEFKRRLARISPKTRVVVLSSFTTIRGLQNGAAYRVFVAAINDSGIGNVAISRPVTPAKAR